MTEVARGSSIAAALLAPIAAAALVALPAFAQDGDRRRRATSADGRQRASLRDRLGAGPADAEPVRRARRGGLQRLVDELGPARQLQHPRTSRRPRASPRAGRSPTTARRSPSSSTRTSLVRRRAGHLEGRQVLARGARRRGRPASAGYTSGINSIETPDDETVVIDDQEARRAASSAACSSTSSPSTSGARCRSRS